MIYSIGHSTLAETDFLALIKSLTVLVDVRSHPTSKWPLFNKEVLANFLTGHNIDYKWEPDLGGWSDGYLHHQGWVKQYGIDIDAYAGSKFPKQRIAAKSGLQGQSWWNQGLLDYSFFMATCEFLDAADRLIELGRSTNVGIMCAEATWWRCHRSMIADHLYYRGVVVQHLLGKKVQPHPIGDRLERYHPDIRAAWSDHVSQLTQ